MGVPGWLLKIVIGFLSVRELILRYKGGTSNKKNLPGGGPQGTRLGLFLFLILINAAGCGNIQKETGQIITKPLNKRKSVMNIHMKFVDDMTMGTAINLKSVLEPNPEPNPPRPLAYHDRTLHLLPEQDCMLQGELVKLQEYASTNQMLINGDKSKVMLFNTAWKYDFMPELKLEHGVILDVVEKFKLLGVVLQSNLKWYSNTDYMCCKGYSRLWMLRRLKGLGANHEEMLDVYDKQIRCVLEMAVAVWESGLTQIEISQIERVQKSAFSVILGDEYFSYERSLDDLNRTRLSERRKNFVLVLGEQGPKI